MAERVAADRQPDATPEPPAVRHCFVTDRYGRLPALLLEWRQRPDGWHDRVVRLVLEADAWIVVERGCQLGLWTRLDSALIRPVGFHPLGCTVQGGRERDARPECV